MNGQQPGPWRGAIAALCALLVGIGLARFAYTPLLPALVDGNWFSASQAAYLGAANLAGYLAGAVLVLALVLNLLLGRKLREAELLFPGRRFQPPLHRRYRSRRFEPGYPG